MEKSACNRIFNECDNVIFNHQLGTYHNPVQNSIYDYVNNYPNLQSLLGDMLVTIKCNNQYITKLEEKVNLLTTKLEEVKNHEKTITKLKTDIKDINETIWETYHSKEDKDNILSRLSIVEDNLKCFVNKYSK
jgi:hypothetical protein